MLRIEFAALTEQLQAMFAGLLKQRVKKPKLRKPTQKVTFSELRELQKSVKEIDRQLKKL